MSNSDEETEDQPPISHVGHFTIPCSWKPKDIDRHDDKIAIVSIFGKTDFDAGGCKASILERMIGRKIFNRDLVHPIKFDKELMAGMEGFYDSTNRVVYLQLTGAYDTNHLIHSLNELNQLLQEKGFLMAWSRLKLEYARCLLFMFSMSHILLLCHPSHVFDITYIHMFKTLNAIRSKSQGWLSDMLKLVPGINKTWLTTGRVCIPRVLFIFSSRLLPAHVRSWNNYNDYIKYGASNKQNRNVSPLRPMELAIEDQIYRLLRNSHIITKLSANSLFGLPKNQTYVYILEEEQEDVVHSSLMSDSLKSFCTVKKINEQNIAKYNEDLDPSSHVTAIAHPHNADKLSESVLAPIATEQKRNMEHNFETFIEQHIEEALDKGFNDNIVRHTHSVFDPPKAGVWFAALNKVYNFFVGKVNSEESKANQMLGHLKGYIETEIKFSNARCSDALPYAKSAYRDGLPPHYTKAQHQAKLDLALEVLAALARGPMYDEFAAQLEKECEKMWLDGRIGCNVLSLTGNSCYNPQHTTGHDSESSMPVMPHKSGRVFQSYCNCGRRQGNLEDPFSAKSCNFDFYNHLGESCCGDYEKISFPTFTPSVQDAKAAQLDASLYGSDRTSVDSVPLSMRESKDQSTTDASQTTGLSFSNALSEQLSITAGTARTAGDSASHADQQVVITVTKDELMLHNKEKAIVRQASTTEYLPGMLHTNSPAGLLPLFSSWSLLCLGPSSLYSHNAGICDQPGFLPGTNFLLPWDVTVKIEDKEKWPAIADSMGKKGFILKNKKNKLGDLSEFNVKIFLGTEYQCMLGHRFMMAAPDRHLKASPQGLIKDTAVKIANADMPLYFPCPCSRSGTVVNGQLMRIHVVTPKAPVNVTLNPQVQPGPEPCQKYIPQPHNATQIKLSASTYWVLRLPYVYVGDSTPHYPPDPRQPSPPSFARLLKGCYGISQVTFDR